MELDALREQIESLDQKLSPIANRPIPFGADFRAYRMPNDEAANQLLAEAVDGLRRFLFPPTMRSDSACI